jgi:hypothetical protein
MPADLSIGAWATRRSQPGKKGTFYFFMKPSKGSLTCPKKVECPLFPRATPPGNARPSTSALGRPGAGPPGRRGPRRMQDEAVLCPFPIEPSPTAWRDEQFLLFGVGILTTQTPPHGSRSPRRCGRWRNQANGTSKPISGRHSEGKLGRQTTSPTPANGQSLFCRALPAFPAPRFEFRALVPSAPSS